MSNILKYLIYFIILILIVLWIFWYKTFSKKLTIINHKINYSEIYFAWVSMPYENKYEKNKFKLEKEYLIRKYQEYQIILYLKRLNQKSSMIDNKLKMSNMPLDLKYVAIVESALRSNVTSPAWAAWIWQFMPETAREYWLSVNKLIDERFHDEKSTDAAILYFEKLYKKFDSWPLALSWYNMGENAINKALNKQNVDSYYDLYLNQETSRYVFKILSIKYILENIDEIYWKDFVSLDNKIQVKEILVEWDKNLLEIAKNYWITYQDIKDLNPWILTEYLPEWLWKIKVY